jgi:OmpA-OmpF porin, OOP family
MLYNNFIRGMLITGSSLFLASNLYAATPGVYVGGQLGAGNINQKGFTKQDVVDINQYALNGHSYTLTNVRASANDKYNLAGRLFVGYQIDPTFAMELGYTQFGKVNSSASGTLNYSGNRYNENFHYSVQSKAIDLVGKAIYPVGNGFNVYGKLGAAYIMEKATYYSQFVTPADGTSSLKAHASANKIYPTFGVGASYDITPNVAADVSYSRIQKISGGSIPSTNFIGAGLIYSIG